MKKHLYPAVFHPEETGYSVSVPDIEGCLSQGDTLEEAYNMIYDAIGLCLEECEELPQATEPKNIHIQNNDFIALIEFDMAEYLKRNQTKAVKKTLTIPSWLNIIAEKNHINFSSVLQQALKEQLNIDRF